VRDHSLQKVPFILAVGGRDRDARTVAIRRLGSETQETLALDAAIATLTNEIQPPA
jgi:threonyl-tRNA synthetase